MLNYIRRAKQFAKEHPFATSVAVGFVGGVVVTRYVWIADVVPTDKIYVNLTQEAVDLIDRDGGVWLNSNAGRFFLTTQQAIDTLQERKIAYMSSVS